jgi:hypothetical protein
MTFWGQLLRSFAPRFGGGIVGHHREVALAEDIEHQAGFIRFGKQIHRHIARPARYGAMSGRCGVGGRIAAQRQDRRDGGDNVISSRYLTLGQTALRLQWSVRYLKSRLTAHSIHPIGRGRAARLSEHDLELLEAKNVTHAAQAPASRTARPVLVPPGLRPGRPL